MRRVTTLMFACFTAASISIAIAQTEPTGYHRVACIKVQDGKWAEYRQYVDEVSVKNMQSAADHGRITSWYLLRSIAPAGEAARCDFVSVTFYAGFPSPPATREQAAAHLKEAGIQLTAEAAYAKRDSVSRLVSQEIWRTVDRVGEAQKGDYLMVNFGKVPNMSEYLELEQKVWKPMAEMWAKDGKQLRAWAVNVPVLPGGSELPYQAMSVDVFPSWDAVFQPRGVAEMFKRVHPGKDYAQTFTGPVNKVRNLGRRELLVLDQKVVAPTRTSQR